MKTYQSGFIRRFSKLSCLLELDAATANQVHREAFSNHELAQAKERLATLSDLQSKLNNTWRCARWLMDVITFARDRGMYGISLKHVLDKETSTSSTSKAAGSGQDSAHKNKLLLEIPVSKEVSGSKATKGRGSWPGPTSSNISGTSNGEGGLFNEFSKSEQQLSRNERGSPFLSVADSRNSDAFNCSALTSSPEFCCNGGELSKSEQQLLFYSPTSYSRSDLHLNLNLNLNLQDGVSKYLDVTEHSIKHVMNKTAENKLMPSRSEDALYSARCCSDSSASCYRSAETSPNLDTRPVVTVVDGSLLSLTNSSDSESGPLSASTPANRLTKPKMPSSKSMTNVKTSLNFNQKLNLNVNAHEKYTRISESNLSKSLTNLKHVAESDALKSPKKTSNSTNMNMNYLKPCDVPGTSSSSQTNNTNKDSNNLQPGILQVYAAYETGLASGTSLKLHVTSRTTAREVVDLVVTQLNMAVALKGKNGPIYPVEKLRNFCLVAVIGARERCLRDDFKPLQLQNPWKKGRLYVRQKQDVLAALEHSTKHSAII